MIYIKFRLKELILKLLTQISIMGKFENKKEKNIIKLFILIIYLSINKNIKLYILLKF